MYDTTTTTNVVVLNTIHIDIMDYIIPASCSDAEFRTMWVEFEWENKVAVNTTITDLHEYLRVLLKSTNMKCLTPEKALSGQCGFMAANIYARSIFGEDALANLSIEKPLDNPDAPVTGHIRIRAKSQVNNIINILNNNFPINAFILGHGFELRRQNKPFAEEFAAREDHRCIMFNDDRSYLNFIS